MKGFHETKSGPGNKFKTACFHTSVEGKRFVGLCACLLVPWLQESDWKWELVSPQRIWTGGFGLLKLVNIWYPHVGESEATAMAQVASTELKLSRSCTCSSYLYHHGIQTIRVYNLYNLIPRMAMDHNPGQIWSPKSFVNEWSIPRSCLHSNMFVHVYIYIINSTHPHFMFTMVSYTFYVLQISYQFHIMYCIPHIMYIHIYIYSSVWVYGITGIIVISSTILV